MSSRQNRISSATVSSRGIARRRAGGFSLLEMLVAAGVLAVALVIVMESISFALTAASRTDRDQTAYRIASDRLNRAAAGHGPVPPEQGQTTFAGVRYDWRVQPVSAESGMRSVQCAVRWLSGGRQQAIALDRRLPSLREGEEGP